MDSRSCIRLIAGFFLMIRNAFRAVLVFMYHCLGCLVSSRTKHGMEISNLRVLLEFKFDVFKESD